MDEYGRWINGVSEPWWFPDYINGEQSRLVQQKWAAYDRENKSSAKDDWEGSYFIGSDTHGSYLRWSRQNGFVLLHVDKCAATVMGFSFGSVDLKSNSVQILPEITVQKPSQHSHSVTISLRLLPVKWRGHRYLIPENEIADFGNYVAGLGKYNDWVGNYIEIVEFYEKIDRDAPETTDDSSRPPATESEVTNFEMPSVPGGFERFIKRPIKVVVTRVGKSRVKRNSQNAWWDDLIVPVTLNAGRRAGVTEGMNFIIAESNETIKVTKVELKTSQAVVVRTTRKKPCVKFSTEDDCGEPEYATLMAGLRASTSAFH